MARAGDRVASEKLLQRLPARMGIVERQRIREARAANHSIKFGLCSGLHPREGYHRWHRRAAGIHHINVLLVVSKPEPLHTLKEVITYYIAPAFPARIGGSDRGVLLTML